MNIFIRILFLAWCALTGGITGKWVADEGGSLFHLIVALAILATINWGILHLINVYLV